MSILPIEKEEEIQIFIIKNTHKKRNRLQDYKNFLIDSWKIQKENISENIDTFLYS